MSHDCETIDISDGPCPNCFKGNEPTAPVKAKPTGEQCDTCTDGYLVERVNSITKNTFIGCSEWPDCNFTKRGGANPAPVKTTTYYYEEECDDFWDDPFYGGSGDMEGPF